MSDFWDFSIAEINSVLASYNRRKTEKFKEKVTMIFLQADVMGNSIFRDDKTLKMQPWDVYPTLFAEERKQFEAYSQQEGLETFKEHRRAAMDRYNARRKEVLE